MTGVDRRRQKIAVVGTGISGLAAAWQLQDHADVTVFEKNRRVGGHVVTVDFDGQDGSTPVDMGFIVYNEQTYPNLMAMFEHLGVATQATDMSLAVSLRGGELEYAGGHLRQLFAQKRNLARPRFWLMLKDLIRFYRNAPRDLDTISHSGITLGMYLDSAGYSAAFRDDHLLPMAAAIWSMPTANVLSYPAHAFIRFHDNHGLLKLANRPLWRTVVGGSRSYVDKLTKEFAHPVRTNAAIVSVATRPEGVFLKSCDGEEMRFDQVVLATHADQALGMLENATANERSILGAFRYNDNVAVLHDDERLMPKRRKAWASWNYIGGDQQTSRSQLTVTYWMNSLQGLPSHRQHFVTLNPNREIEDDRIVHSEYFEHPIIDAGATDAQRKLWSLQGQRGIWFCGAYFGAGFHEDGLQAGLAVAEAISGARRPWRVDNESGRIFVDANPPASRFGSIAA
jgi:predicted NAD/FAD-binding protein